MDGSAVTTTSASRITMKDAAEVSSKVSAPPEVPRPGDCPVPGGAVPGRVPRSEAVIGDSSHPPGLVPASTCLSNGAGPRWTLSSNCYPGADDLETLLAPAGQEHLSALGRKRFGNRRADRTAGAEHDCALALQQRIRRHASAPSLRGGRAAAGRECRTCRRQRVVKRGAPRGVRPRPLAICPVKRAGD